MSNKFKFRFLPFLRSYGITLVERGIVRLEKGLAGLKGLENR